MVSSCQSVTRSVSDKTIFCRPSWLVPVSLKYIHPCYDDHDDHDDHDPKFFWPKIFFDPKIFWIKILFFDPKFFLTQKYFWPKISFDPKNFLTQHFFYHIFYRETKINMGRPSSPAKKEDTHIRCWRTALAPGTHWGTGFTWANSPRNRSLRNRSLPRSPGSRYPEARQRSSTWHGLPLQQAGLIQGTGQAQERVMYVSSVWLFHCRTFLDITTLELKYIVIKEYVVSLIASQ